MRAGVVSVGLKIVVLSVALASGGVLQGCCKCTGSVDSGSDKPAKIGETVAFKGDSEWEVVDAKDFGKTIEASNDFTDPGKTKGRFIRVHYKVTNKGKKSESILEGPKLVDGKGREFETWSEGYSYLPKNGKAITLEPLPPDMEKEFYAIYEVPADAEDLKFQARALEAFGKKRTVDLELKASKGGGDDDDKKGDKKKKKKADDDDDDKSKKKDDKKKKAKDDDE
jgi:hypothetical protein